jgi:hypothetical protein
VEKDVETCAGLPLVIIEKVRMEGTGREKLAEESCELVQRELVDFSKAVCCAKVSET